MCIRIRQRLVKVVLLLTFLPVLAFAEPNDQKQSLDLNLMVTPSSPAFTILGVEPAVVDRPGTATDLKISIMNATNNLSVLPKDYALEFTPSWLFWGKNIEYSDYEESFAPLQTLSLSTATVFQSTVVPDTFTQSLGLGFHSSIFRGEIDREFKGYASRLDTLHKKQAKLNDIIQQRIESWKHTSTIFNTPPDPNNPKYNLLLLALKAEELERVHQDAEREIREKHATDLEEIGKIVSSMQVRRVGLKWDVAGALALDFPQGNIGDVSLTKFGIWTTLGYEGQDEIVSGLDLNGSFLLLARYLGDLNDQDQSNIDFGGRGILTKTKQGISVSVEGVGRLPPSFDFDDFDWRLAGIVELGFFRNTAVSFTFGRDFDNDLLSAINFSWGLGSDRPIR